MLLRAPGPFSKIQSHIFRFKFVYYCSFGNTIDDRIICWMTVHHKIASQSIPLNSVNVCIVGTCYMWSIRVHTLCRHISIPYTRKYWRSKNLTIFLQIFFTNIGGIFIWWRIHESRRCGITSTIARKMLAYFYLVIPISIGKFN